MDRKIRIALVEDLTVNRQSFLRKTLEMAGCTLLFVAKNGHDFLEQLKGLPQGRMPEVVFMDIEMPGMDGIEATRLSKAIYPTMHILMLSIFDDDDKIFAAIQAGAEGYLLKHESAAALQEAAQLVLEFGGAPLSPAVARKALMLLRRAEPSGNPAPASRPQGVSERELEVLEHMVSGLDAKSIATQMGLSVFTVRKHIANVYEKLHVGSKAQVMSLAHKQGWFK